MDNLNPQQRQAAETIDGPLLIVAGPGTGKTKTLTARMAHLIAVGAAKPEQVLALTFTKKAAEEMRSRVTALVQAPPYVATFHSLCHELLGGDLDFIAEPQRLAIIKKLTRPASLKHLSVRELALLVSRAKNLAEDDAALVRFVAAYNAALAEQNLHDFDDLLLKLRDQLRQDNAKRRAVQARFSHILVDEFQDTNKLQYELLQLIRGNDNLCVIGDPNQSIYGFRGANGAIFEQFTADFPNRMAIALQTNYRSAPQIVALSNAIFTEQPQLEAAQQTTGQVQAVQALNEYSEARWVVDQIQLAIGGSDLRNAVSTDQRHTHKTLADFAVLYRSRAAALALRRALDESGLPYQVAGDGSPYDTPVLQSLVALLKACQSGEPVAAAGFSRQQCAVLLEKLDATQQPSRLATQIIEQFGFEPTADTQQLVNSLVRFKQLREAVDYLGQLAEQSFYDPRADAITLLTIHAAKGLEFSHVFLLGAEEGLLPDARADIAEETRLFYVAATRAKDRLDILYTTRRAGQPAKASRFITRLSAAVLPQITDPGMARERANLQKRSTKRNQASLF